MKIKLIVVEENIEIRNKFIYLMQFYNMFEVVGEFSSSEVAIEFISSNNVDVVFINLKVGSPDTGGDGSYLAVSLREHYPDIIVVSYSNKESYAYSAYNFGCAEYFELPFDSIVLLRVVNRIKYLFELIQYKKDAFNRSMMIKTKDGYQLIKVSDVLFIERDNRKNKIVCIDGKEIILSRYTMEQLEDVLKGYNFYRCYQSFIINLSKVSFIKVNSESKNYSIMFEGYDGEVLLSRDKYSEIVNLLKDKFTNFTV